VIPYFARQELLLDYGLLIADKSNCRICKDHLLGEQLKPDLNPTCKPSMNLDCELTPTEAAQVIKDLIGAMKKYRAMSHLDFGPDGGLTDKDYQLWTGWTKAQFDVFEEYLTGVNSSHRRSKREALAMFWVKLKSDLGFAQIASLFNLDDPAEGGRIIVSNAFHSVAEALNKNFVPFFLGVDHMTPEQAKDYATIYSAVFFGEHTTTIWDGTYLYLFKSTNYLQSRLSYSMHKHLPLSKFMSIILPNGYVLDVVGPFYADGKNNDAGITWKILQDQAFGVLEWLKKADFNVMIMDRGFRNVIEELEKIGNVSAKMPSVSKSKQHTVLEANQSRLVTKIRWTVEAYHGRLKKWRFFYNRQPTAHLTVLKECIRITTAALNAFRPPLYDTTNHDEYKYHLDVAHRMMKSALSEDNVVFDRVKKGVLSSRGRLWQEVVSSIEEDEVELSSEGILLDFPVLSEEEICEQITCGTYQVKQAQHYADEHLGKTSGFLFFVHKSAPDLIRVRLQSRHKNSAKYFVWVQFSPKTETKKGTITGWYCQCKAGARTVGCCAHVATSIWFLGYARHHGYRPSPNIHNFWRQVINANAAAQFVDSDEEEKED